MSFNLLDDSFFPVITRSGARKWIAFPGLAEIDADYPVEFDWPRADFNVAAFEFAIGVATLAFPLLRKGEWAKLWAKPPSKEALREALRPLSHAFFLAGEGPRFLQELGGLDGEGTPIEALLIDTPGANGQKKNADVLTHRGRYWALGLPAAGMALYALQQFAPSGGAGNRTSMRGGGPLTTLVIPGAEADQRPPLWRIILANFSEDPGFEYDLDDLPKILPWLAPTLVSDKAHGQRVVHEADSDVHELQAFFGMPRRIVLRSEGDGVCPMTGERGPLVAAFIQKPWGVNYGLWRHPLTPYRRQKEAPMPLTSVKPKSGRFGYRDWVAVTIGETKNNLAMPASPVASALADRAMALQNATRSAARLKACGWAMNNMEAVAYLSAEQPLHLAADPDKLDVIKTLASNFANAADEVAALLRFALRNALFAEGAKPSTDSGVFDDVRTSFYEATEDDFHEALDALIADSAIPGDEDMQRQSRYWLRRMAQAAQAAFSQMAPVPIADPEHAKRIVGGFSMLRAGLSGYGKFGASLFQTLALPPVETKSKKGVSRGK